MEGRDDDDGRGWCCLEDAVSRELITRLQPYPRVANILQTLPAKVLVIDDGVPVPPPDLEVANLADHVESMMERIRQAAFTSGKDSKEVPRIYQDYVKRTINVLQRTIGLKEVREFNPASNSYTCTYRSLLSVC